MTDKPQSPLDELRVSADAVWDKIAPGYALTDEDITKLVAAERAMREAWIKKSTKSAEKREEKKYGQY